MKVCMHAAVPSKRLQNNITKEAHREAFCPYPMGLDFANETQHNLWQTVLPPNH